MITNSNNHFRYAGIDKFDINNGNGIGVTLFVQGCSHHCKGCHNVTTWDKNGGKIFSDDSLIGLKKLLSSEVVDRFTLSGGDPLDNIEFSNYILDIVKSEFPTKQIWIFSGYTYEEIQKDENKFNIIKKCHVLVDGEYECDKKNLRLKFRGSENQRVIDISRTISYNKITLWEERN